MKHIVHTFTENSHSYSGLVLLNQYLSMLEDRAWIVFRSKFISKKLKENGKLVCEYCKREDLTDGGPKSTHATLDHVVPRCEGGKDIDTNVVVCCSSCNKKKAEQSQQEFKNSRYLKLKLQCNKVKE